MSKDTELAIPLQTPAFDSENSESWLKQFEMVIRLRGVTKRTIWFQHLVPSLPTAIVTLFAELTSMPPNNESYDRLKQAIISPICSLQHASLRGTAHHVESESCQNVAPSHFDHLTHLFRSMVHGLAHHHFSWNEELKNWIDSWILWKDEEVVRRGIRLLPERWAKVVANDGQYFRT
nr:Mariner Mos1 transposase [Hymenolepis microstoma]